MRQPGVRAVAALGFVVAMASACGRGGVTRIDRGPDDEVVFRRGPCPPRGGSFPPGRDRFSPLVHLVRREGARTLHVPPIHMALLPDGRVLMPGSTMREAAGPSPNVRTDNHVLVPQWPEGEQVVELTPVHAPDMTGGDNLFCAGHTLLADGRLFVAGGDRTTRPCAADAPCLPRHDGVAYAQILAEDGSSFRRVSGDMPGGPRWYPTTTRMPDGSVVVTGGHKTAGYEHNFSVDHYDAARASWTALSATADTPAALEIFADYPHAYVLPKPVEAGGRSRGMLVLGGYGIAMLFSPETTFDGPARERWVLRAPRPGPSGLALGFGAAGALLPLAPRNEGAFNQGAVLVVGGSIDAGVRGSASVYDPYTDAWCPAAGEGLIARFQASTVLLPDGTVLIVSGNDAYPPVRALDAPQRTPQILDPSTGALYTGTPWPDRELRAYHNTALLLPDGRVLVAGGRTYEGGDPDVTGLTDERTDLRYYEPPYLGVLQSGAARPRLVEPSLDHLAYGGSAAVRYEGGPIERVTLLALGAHTHSFDQSQRHLTLDFEADDADGALTVYGPRDAPTAPPGHYMLFLLKRVDGWLVPSVAKIITVG